MSFLGLFELVVGVFKYLLALNDLPRAKNFLNSIQSANYRFVVELKLHRVIRPCILEQMLMLLLLKKLERLPVHVGPDGFGAVERALLLAHDQRFILRGALVAFVHLEVRLGELLVAVEGNATEPIKLVRARSSKIFIDLQLSHKVERI